MKAVAAGKWAMLSFWTPEDFRPKVVGLDGLNDHWEPIIHDARELAFTKSQRGLQNADFWDPLPAPPKTVNSTSSEREPDWFDYVELPLFEARAFEHPFGLPREQDRAESLQARRARWLLSLLDVPSSIDRRRFLGKFIELFEHFNHANTFKAVSDLALNGASADDIITAFHLKLAWAECPIFWSIRQSKVRAPFIPQNGQAMLTWTKAVRLTILSKGLPAECIIRDDWYEEWLVVPFGDPAFWFFIDYVTLRLEAFAAGALELPDELRRKDVRSLPSPSFGGNSLDGTLLGSPSRTGQLVRLATDAWGLSCLTDKVSEAAAE
ncbi:hypothetical protein LQG66_28970 [Bradyrhizobium ontarionense]|uniref:Uncharacterized protein n=1 Tax=Bradyrhizobium ontarionense TaxID=2898149 RepID=A0ABY3R8G9_9BRAD|nr:hypothetical protein [Bradyrhizobium sp. A19]UFZ03239.1 hypothetical protein LQG66_28970 [Bradyrhizobium sp. A19]